MNKTAVSCGGETPLTFDTYEVEAARTAVGFRNGRDKLLCAALGLAGEAGEFADAVKKMLFHGHPNDPAKLVKEIGDVLWYCALAAHSLGVDLAEVAARNIAKLRMRYPAGFSTEASQARVDVEQPREPS